MPSLGGLAEGEQLATTVQPNQTILRGRESRGAGSPAAASTSSWWELFAGAGHHHIGSSRPLRAVIVAAPSSRGRLPLAHMLAALLDVR